MSYLSIVPKWRNFFNSKNYACFYNIYNNNSTLIPTFSEKVICKEEFPSYFESEDLKNSKVLFESVNFKNLNNEKIIFGDYVFLVDDKKFFSNYSFFIKFNLISKKYEIYHHHSSLKHISEK